MLQITITPKGEFFDEEKQEFIPLPSKPQTIQLEHSLISISKWEEKWHKPFLDNKGNTTEELYDYIRCMTITQNVNPELYYHLSEEDVIKIKNYIDDEHTATWFSEEEKKNQKKAGRNGGTITSEIIYYWMVALQIPFECQKWHLNRLLTLIRVCEEKNRPKDKMTKGQILSRNRALNEARRKALNSRG